MSENKTGNFEIKFKAGYVSGEKSLTRGEFEKLISVIPHIEHLLLIKLAVATGIRRDDIVKIKIADIDFPTRRINFNQSKKKNIHTVNVSDSIIVLIKQHLNTITQKHKKSGLLFSFKGRQAYNILNTYCERAGIPKRPFHSLRATCSKFCKEAGWSDQQIARHLDDKIETIVAHYTVASDSEMSEVADKKAIV